MKVVITKAKDSEIMSDGNLENISEEQFLVLKE